jgi:methylase of polypeptide subunit release factors
MALALQDCTVHGFDDDPAAVVIARRAAAVAGVSDRVTFEVAPLDAFLGGGYDLVVMRGRGGVTRGQA